MRDRFSSARGNLSRAQASIQGAIKEHLNAGRAAEAADALDFVLAEIRGAQVKIRTVAEGDAP